MSPKRIHSVSLVALVVMVGLGILQMGNIVSAALQSASLVATKTVALTTDQDSDGQADPGDTLRYTISITNNGTPAATNVQIQDTIDSQTTFVPGSVRVSPVGVSDSYSATGNVRIAVNAANGVLANDYRGVPQAAAPIASYTAASANGGTVTLNPADGSFTYDPPPGFEGTDSFTYTLATNGVGPATLSPTTVSISVSDLIWFVNPDGSPAGDGRLSSPYSGLGAYNTAALDEAGDFIFLFSGSQSTGITLKNSQWLIGQGVALSDQLTAAGITLAAQTDPALLPLPAAGANPIINSATGNGITLAQNNTVRGVTVANTTGTGIAGANVGTWNASKVSVIGSGKGVSVNTGVLNVSLDEVSSTNNTGIELNSVTGTFDVTTGVINALNAPGVTVNGSVTLGVTLERVSAQSTPSGIILNGPAGSFTVSGSSTVAGSGGIIQNTTNGALLTSTGNVTLKNMNFTQANNVDGGAAVNLTNVNGITLDNVNITGVAQYGINGTTVNAFNLLNSTVTQCGNAAGEGCLKFQQLTGLSTIVNSTLSFAAEHTAQVTNTSGVLQLGVKNSTFSDSQSSATGADGLEVMAQGTANVTVGIDGSSFLRNRTYGFQMLAEGTSIARVDIFNSTFNAGTGFGSGIGLAANDSAQLAFNVTGNPMIRPNGGGTAVSVYGGMSSTVQGRITDNPAIQHEAIALPLGVGVDVRAENASQIKVLVANNVIVDSGHMMIIQTVSSGTSARIDATINNNSVVALPTVFSSISVQATGTTTTCANITNNMVTQGILAAFVEQTDVGATMLLQGFNTNPMTTWITNGNNPPSVVWVNSGTLAGGTCLTPTHTDTPVIVLYDVHPSDHGESFVHATGDAPALAPATKNTFWARLASPLPVSAESSLSSAGAADALTVVETGEPIQGLRRSGETVTLAEPVPVLPAGASVTITFDVVIDSPLTAGTTQVCNQSTVTAAGGLSVLTDDPGVAGASDPTCLAVDTPATPSLTKTFAPDSIELGATTTLTFTVANNDTTDTLTNLSFGDTLPVTAAGELAFVASTTSGTCLQAPANGSALLSTTTATNDTLSVSGITLGPSSQCTVAVTVQSAAAGTYDNTTTVLASDQVIDSPAASDTLIVLIPEPTITKVFAPDSVGVGEMTELTFTVTNNATVPLTNASFSDALPVTAAGELAFVASTASGTCLEAPANGSALLSTTTTTNDTLSVTGMALAADSSCSVTVDVSANAAGTFNNTSSVVSSTEVTGMAGAQDTLTVIFPEPTITKVFAPDAINIGETSALTFTVTNNAAVPLTDARFSDLLLPAVTAGDFAFVTGTETGTCLEAPFNGTAALTTSVATNDTLLVTGMALAANSSCSVTVDVAANAAGTLHNLSGVVSSTEVTGTTGSQDTLTVTFPEPTITKVFAPDAINIGETTVLTFTVTNNAAVPLTSATFSDALPVTAAGELAFVTGTESGTCLEAPFNGTAALSTTVAGDDTLSVTGLALAANSSCSVTVDVAGNAAGTFNNASSVVSSTEVTGTATAQDTLTVTFPEPTITKAFAPDAINVSETTVLTFTVTNNAAVPLTAATFSDALPVTVAGELAFVASTVSGTCLEAPFNGTVALSTTVASDDTLSVTGMALAASGGADNACTLTVDVAGNAAGSFNNTSSVVSSTEVTGTATAQATLIVGVPEPTLVKVFAPETVNVGDTTALTFTLTNNAVIPLTSATFSDALPITAAGELAFVTGTETGTCLEAPFNGTLVFSTTVAGDDTLTISGITLAASSDPDNACTLTVDVNANAAGSFNNTSSVVTSAEITGTTTAQAMLNVVVPEPAVAKAFAPEMANEGGLTELTFTVTNNAAIPLTGATFSDALPITAAGELAFVAGTESGTCLEAPYSGTAAFGTTTAGDDTLTISGITLAASGDPDNACTLTVEVSANLSGVYDNVTSVVSSDQVTGTTTGSATLTVGAPLEIAKAFAPDTVIVGETARLTIAAVNHSATPLTGATFSDELPITAAGELAFVAGTESGTCLEAPFNGTVALSTTTAGDDTLTASGITLAANGDAANACTLSIDVVANAAGTYNNVTSTITSDQSIGIMTGSATLTVNEPGDNPPGDPTEEPPGGDPTVPGQPQITSFDPALSKRGELLPGQLGLPGEQLTWVITLTNNGGVAGTGLVVTDTQPEELRIDRVETDRGDYLITGQTVTFTIPILEPGESIQMRIIVTVLRSPAGGELLNIATLEGAGQTRSSSATLSVPVTLPDTGYPQEAEGVQPRSHRWGWGLTGAAGLLGVMFWRNRRARRSHG